jgi:hypothetical protein
MQQAVIFAVAEDNAFAMRSDSGVVVLAVADAPWSPKVGVTLSGFRHELGRSSAVEDETHQSVRIDITVCSDVKMRSQFDDTVWSAPDL